MVKGHMTEVTIKVIDERLRERLSRGLHKERRRTDPSHPCGVMKAAEGGIPWGSIQTAYNHICSLYRDSYRDPLSHSG